MINSLKTERRYTYQEFLEIDDENRYELIDGILYMMSAPSPRHQSISSEILRQLGNFLDGKKCSVTHEINVKLFADDDANTVIPDILVICDSTKFAGITYEGVPDFIIEITSPSNSYRDYLDKLNDYRRAGVKEYWIIDPENNKVFVNILEGNNYSLSHYDFGEISVAVLAGCTINLTRFSQTMAQVGQ